MSYNSFQREQLQNAQDNTTALTKQLLEQTSAAEDSHEQLKVSKKSVNILAEQLQALEDTVQLQDVNIGRLLHELKGRNDQMGSCQDNLEVAAADLQLANDRATQAEAEAERAVSEAQKQTQKSRKLESEFQSLKKGARSSRGRVQELERQLQDKAAELEILKEIVNSVKIQAKRATRGINNRFEPTRGEMPPRGHRSNKKSSRSHPPPLAGGHSADIA